MALRRSEAIDPALRKRVASGTLLAGVVLADVLIGGWFFAVLVLAAVLLMAHEWTALASPSTPEATHLLMLTVAAVPSVMVVAVMVERSEVAVIALGIGSVAGAGTAALVPGGSVHRTAGGIAYLGLPATALVWLRMHEGGGSIDVIWLLLVVWATDCLAYFTGRGIGGPKLAPQISPSKTWAGLIGGVAGAAIVGGGVSLGLGAAGLAPTLLAAILAVISQVGDLFESHLKRRAGVKDSGALIPGHGGVLDRVDGLLFAAPVYMMAVALMGIEVTG
jgi:phosphatidate cytidylyltransferase